MCLKILILYNTKIQKKTERTIHSKYRSLLINNLCDYSSMSFDEESIFIRTNHYSKIFLVFSKTPFWFFHHSLDNRPALPNSYV